MRQPSAGMVRWLLFSDLHFKHHDLDRVWKTAQWIAAEAERYKVRRAVVCGDLLTSRTMQPTHVLSACYRFIGLLSDVVPRVHILLGNHDLAYRRDYQTTALDALNIKRLAPYVSVHHVVAHHEWDGRHVLLLPFREEQNELTEAIAALDPKAASKTVAFAHLAINKAITQRHVVGADIANPRATNLITYRGLTGPDRFASLARTFTGHFHSHQTITQKHSGCKKDHLQGSVIYLGSPLQLNWGDLYDEQRGVVLLDPKTLKHELVVNPHAACYITADLQQVLDGQVDESAVRDKHVMLIGKLNHLKYVTARDKLLSLGVRSVRDWTPISFSLRSDHQQLGRLGASVPASDAAIQRLEDGTKDQTVPAPVTDAVSDSDPGAAPSAKIFDLAMEAREYVESLDLDESLLLRRDELARVGQRIIEAAHEMVGKDDEVKFNHQDFLDRSSQAINTRTTTALSEPSAHTFVAEPRMLTITNFLGVQNTITINFQQDLPRGLTFLVGDNGSGKSTLIEAMTWCQFGQCIRGGLAVNDVVNDNVGKNCSVKLEFANGYAIKRYRKHKVHGNRVVISLRGEPQPQFEHSDVRTTQAAINELLGIDYETYVSTVVLSQEGAASFLSSTPAQRRDLIEALLGLSILDQCGQVSRLLLKDVDHGVNDAKGKLDGLVRTIDYCKGRLKDLDRTRKQIEKETEKAVASLETAIHDHESIKSRIKEQGPYSEEYISPGYGYQKHHLDLADNKEQILVARKASEASELSMCFRAEISLLENQIHKKKEDMQRMENHYARMQDQNNVELMSWPGRLQHQLGQKLEEAMAAAHPSGLRKYLHAMETSILRLLLRTVSSLLSRFKILREHSPGDSDQIHDQEVAINSLRQDIVRSTARLQSLKHQEKLATNHALMIEEQLERVVRAQKEREALQKEAVEAQKAYEALQEQAIEAQKSCEVFHQQVTMKRADAATYKHLIETEQSSLQSLESEYDALAIEIQELAADRELFAFWSSSLAKRTRSASSSSSPKTAAKSTANFREHIFEKSLPELNALFAQILTVLYDDTRHHSHAHMASGILRSLFVGSGSDSANTSSSPSSASVLGRNLAVHPSLAYGKRSSGERKRVDLALFFALLQLARARSAHRAQYVLVDEVFDSLDEAGQAAMVRWCGAMSRTLVGWTVVITHSQFSVEQDLGEGGDAGKVLVVRARMGDRGTELFVNGWRIGGE